MHMHAASLEYYGIIKRKSNHSGTAKLKPNMIATEITLNSILVCDSDHWQVGICDWI